MGDQRQPEWLEAGPRPRRDLDIRRRRWLAGLAAALIAVVAAAGARSLAGSSEQGRLDPAPSTFWSGSTPSRSPAPGPPVVVSGPTLPDVGNWEVYGRSEAEVVRLELRLGRMTRTPVPQLATSGRISFLATRTGVLVRPVRDLPGYQVRDSERAAPLPRALGRGGLILSGPEPDQVWITSTSRYTSRGEMLLVSLSSGWVRVQAGLPVFTFGSVQPDGAGSFHIGSTGGTYLRVPGGYRRISTGTVLAANRASWLSAECDERLRCRHVLVDRRSGTRRVVRLLPDFNIDLALVSLSPDSRYIAVAYRLGTQSPVLHVIDLKTGADRVVPAAVDSGLPNGSVVWSPTSDYLAAVGARGRLVIIGSATAAIVPLGPDLPPVSQLAAKPV
jgi:hypothetical protein